MADSTSHNDELVTDQLTVSALQILSLIWSEGPISRTALAERTGLAHSSITRLARILDQHKLIKAVRVGESTGGRPPILLAMNEEAGVILALDLGSSQLRGAVYNALGATLYSVDSPFVGTGREAIEKQVMDVVVELVEASERLQKRPLAIAMSIPGAVDVRNGVIVRITILDIENYPIGAILHERFQLPVVLEHDTIAAAYAERHYGAGRNSENMIYLTVSQGIGAGIVLNNRIYRGEKGFAGEIGHVTVMRDGPRCVCGRRGCLEAVAGTGAIVQRTRELLAAEPLPSEQVTPSSLRTVDPAELTARSIIDAANQGDPIAQQVLRESADYLAQAVGIVTCVLDIGTIILGGEIMTARENYLEPLRSSLPHYQFSVNPPVILPALMDQDASIKGVGMLALQRVLGLTRSSSAIH